MDYEKKYKELVGKIDKAYLYAQTDSTKAVLEEIRNELKESEDERIRQFLVDFIKVCRWTEKKDQGWPSRENCIAWLEKQGEKANPYSGVFFKYNGHTWGMCARDKDIETITLPESKVIVNQKPTWSKKDENEVSVLEAYIRSNDWSEQHIDRALGIVDELVNKVKSLKPQKCVNYNPYKAAVESIAEMCERYDVASYSDLRVFYDNVKIKCRDAIEYNKKYSQKLWKPKQMKVLHDINLTGNISHAGQGQLLVDLYNDLKKL